MQTGSCAGLWRSLIPQTGRSPVHKHSHVFLSHVSSYFRWHRARTCLPVIWTFSHSLIPSTSRLRINYISIDWPLGRGIDIHGPPSAPRPMCIPQHRSPASCITPGLHYLLYFSVAAGREGLFGEKFPVKRVFQPNHVYAQITHKLRTNRHFVSSVCSFKLLFSIMILNFISLLIWCSFLISVGMRISVAVGTVVWVGLWRSDKDLWWSDIFLWLVKSIPWFFIDYQEKIWLPKPRIWIKFGGCCN